MMLLVIIGFIAFIFGILFILFPDILIKMAEWANTLAADIDDKALKYRVGVGLSLIISAAFIWFIAYYMKVMPVLAKIN